MVSGQAAWGTCRTGMPALRWLGTPKPWCFVQGVCLHAAMRICLGSCALPP